MIPIQRQAMVPDNWKHLCEDGTMLVERRVFLKTGGWALLGAAPASSLLTQALCDWTDSCPGNKRLVVVFQRGGADGLNMVVPHGERAYYAMRPSISIPRSAVLDLDGFFGLHPSLSPLLPLWRQ